MAPLFVHLRLRQAKKAAWFKIVEGYEKEDELSGRLSEALVLFQSGKEVTFQTCSSTTFKM